MLGCKQLKSFHTNGRSNALLLPIIPVSMHILLLIVVTFSIIAIIIVVCVGFDWLCRCHHYHHYSYFNFPIISKVGIFI